jgi:RimJ/RimL family protein N-acetyltransferase
MRLLEEKDFESFRRLFEDAYAEYLQFLKRENPQQYLKERQERREVTRERFDFYLKTGSSFIAEENGDVIGYVASQTVFFTHGVDRQLWIEYIVVHPEFRRRGIGLALLDRLKEYAKRSGIDEIYTTMNPDNEASVKVHRKAGFNVRKWNVASYETTK